MSKHEQEGQFQTKGFLFYDLIHIVTAVIILITLFITDAKHVVSDPIIGSEFTSIFVTEVSEILLGILLIFFTDFLYENIDAKIERMAYTFAFIIAALALVIPTLFGIKEVVSFVNGQEMRPGLFILALLKMFFPITAMNLFASSLFRVKTKIPSWSRLLVWGMILMLLTSITSIAYIIMELVEGEEFTLIVAMEMLSCIAPALPIFFGLNDLHNMGLILPKKGL